MEILNILQQLGYNKTTQPSFEKKEGSNVQLKNEAENEKLRKACQDFEALFVTNLLKTMRSSESPGGMFGKGFGGEFYQSLLEAEVAQKVTRGGGMGLSDILYNSFLKHVQNTETPKMMNGTEFDRIGHYHSVIQQASSKYGISVPMIYAVIGQESSGNPDVISKKGAKGLMQLMDETALDLGVKNVFDPEENIFAGVRYLRQMKDRFGGDMTKALAAYNAGPSNVIKYNGVPPFAETEQYVQRVAERAIKFEQMLDKSGKQV